MNDPLAIYMVLAENPLLLCISVMLTSVIVAAKS